MKTLGRPLGIDARFRYLYRPMLRKLLMLGLLAVVIAGSAMVYFDERIVRSMSATVIRNSSDATALHLGKLADTAKDALLLAQQQVERQDLVDASLQAQAVERLLPFLETYPVIGAVTVGDSDGNEVSAFRDGDIVRSSTRNAANPGLIRWRRWRDGVLVEAGARATDEPLPAERPWFAGALAAAPGERIWGEPYVRDASGALGVTIATRWPDDGGAPRAIAINANLDELSNYTAADRPSPNGITMIFDEAGRVLGLPAGVGDAGLETGRAELLSPAVAVGSPAASAAVREWENRSRPTAIFDFVGADGERWWAGFRAVRVDEGVSVWSAAIVPQADLLGGISRVRNWSLAGIALLAAMLGAAILGMSLRSIRRQVRGELELVERKLGQYHIEQRIGQGGNGTVYRASHALLRRPTALKLMSPAFADSEAARERFEHEVRLTSRLSHPNTISIYDFGRTADGTLYYAMELLNGTTLERLVHVAGRLPGARVIALLRQICGSLAEAHAKGLIHRDIKPSNVIVCERGGVYDVVKVLDFGLVTEIAPTDGKLMQGDVLIGTPFYMAPETIREPGQASAQSDLYALGAVGYYLLTGLHVFEGASAVDICSSHLHDAPVPPSERIGAAVPADLELLILQCLAKDPGDRPQSAEALSEALAGCADAGGWSDADARSWWREYASGFGTADEASDTPMSHTELLVDIDSRLLSGKATVD